MPYTTLQGLVDRFGSDAVVLASDRVGAGAADTAAVDQAVVDASDEIDSYLAARYTLPLASVPGVLLERLAADIALYRLSFDSGTLTDEKRRRYEDAVRLLQAIAKGTASLGPAGSSDAPPPAAGGARGEAPGRLFTPDTLKTF